MRDYKWKQPLKYTCGYWSRKAVTLFCILCVKQEDTVNNSTQLTRELEEMDAGKVSKKNQTCPGSTL